LSIPLNLNTADEVVILEESEETPLKTLIKVFFETKLPQEVYDERDKDKDNKKTIGIIIFLELFEDEKTKKHVLIGGFIPNI